ncbi:MAG: Zinc uptake regulation protein [Actinomycetota bacterium]
MPNESRQRTTRQKTAIVDALTQHNEFLSAQQWHQLLKDNGQEIGLSTVYRTLTALSELGDVDVLMREDGEALYRSCSDAHHHHLLCRECGTTVEISATEVESWAASIAKKHKFSDIHHVVELSGICQDCS